MSLLRFTDAAAAALRTAIADAGGVEVFAIGEVLGTKVVGVTPTCRGREDRVTALLDRPRAGQVVIHNHPSGDLRPSNADLRLASLYGEDGVGMVIVDDDVTHDNWVVEPLAPRDKQIDRVALDAFFAQGLPQAMPDFEPREAQLEMARRVADALDHEQPAAIEAGTGTGKSLAYLVPAALWALAHDDRVVISTYTRALQSQLQGSDLPLLARGGVEVRTAVLQGRNNYLCKRRMGLALAQATDGERAEIEALQAWAEATREGTRAELGFELSPAVWERVQSDTDLSLRVRCPHFDSCHYYKARRRAAGAHLVVVNHALLLVDLALREQAGRGVLPKYRRLIVDEGHHLEPAATGAASTRLTARAISRAVAPLLSSKRRRGALQRTQQAFPELAALEPVLIEAADQATAARDEAAGVLEHLASVGLGEAGEPSRLTRELLASQTFSQEIAPALLRLGSTLQAASEALAAIEPLLDGLRLTEAQLEPVLDLRRARRRLAGHAQLATSFVGHQRGPTCRWIERARDRKAFTAAVVSAPIAVAPTLRRILWDQLPGVVATSATLTTGRHFQWWGSRVGLPEGAQTALLPSPFDHAKQALLALPRDLPEPNHPDFLAQSAAVITQAIRASGGGAFVLCTSYVAVRAYARALSEAVEVPVLAQGTLSRPLLLERFKQSGNAVLVGTDSFWEGVSVKGMALRLVVIPRLPFRVPTEPLRVAQHEHAAELGQDPFKTCALPEAVLKLRQGYGRLIRHRDDRGVVLILDRRLHGRSYGRVMLHSLPPARRVVGPLRRVMVVLEGFFGALLSR